MENHGCVLLPLARAVMGRWQVAASSDCSMARVCRAAVFQGSMAGLTGASPASPDSQAFPRLQRAIPVKAAALVGRRVARRNGSDGIPTRASSCKKAPQVPRHGREVIARRPLGWATAATPLRSLRPPLPAACLPVSRLLRWLAML